MTVSERASLSPLFGWRGAIAESNLRPTVKHVALTLSLHMSELGESCFPSHRTLCDETGLADSTVRDALRDLRAAGWLSATVRLRDDGGQTSNNYSAHVPVASQRRRAAISTGPCRHGNTPPDGTATGGPVASPSPKESVSLRASSESVESGESKPKRRKSQPDPLFDAVVEACSMDYDEMTTSARRSCAIAVSELRKVDARPGDVAIRAHNYRAHFGDAALTPNALAKHWAQCRTGPVTAQRVSAKDQLLAQMANEARGSYIETSAS